VILEYKSGAPVTRPAADKARFVAGPATAPVSMTEWTDIMCGHCAEFVLTLKEIMGRLPPGMVRVEPRQFPLDKECNPTMERSVGDGVRCAAARALVCLEGSDAFFEAQIAMFKEQSALTKPRVLELARAQAFDKQAFDRCLGAPETQKKIDADIAAAVAAGLHGTPHVLLNGKVAPPFGPFLYLYLAGGGKLEHPALALLPPGKPPEPHDHAH
jgi:protein-disulfide isomerase